MSIVTHQSFALAVDIIQVRARHAVWKQKMFDALQCRRVLRRAFSLLDSHLQHFKEPGKGSCEGLRMWFATAGAGSKCCKRIDIQASCMRLDKTISIIISMDAGRRALHVQSISRWAPACIGPYSQATSHQDVLFMAGQLGLDPASMTLVQPAVPCAAPGGPCVLNGASCISFTVW